MLAVIDYGAGNLRSVLHALDFLGCGDLRLVREPRDLDGADRIILPGVGAFGAGMQQLRRQGLVRPLIDAVERGIPYLGICLGMHLLFTESEEFGISRGLDIIKGRVVRFKGPQFETQNAKLKTVLKVPHMGWNSLMVKRSAPALQDVPDGSHVYFVHSFHVVPEDKDVIATTTDYGMEFVSSIWKDNIFATQFHPEKSQALGLSILKRFGEQKG